MDERNELINKFQRWLDTNPRKELIAAECANIAEEYAERKLNTMLETGSSKIKPNKKDEIKFPQFNAGDIVKLDEGFLNGSVVEVVKQTKPKGLFVRVKAPNGYEWEVMSNRLTQSNK